MVRISFLLRQPKKKGINAIYATVRYHGQTVILFPGISIHTNDWINKKGVNKPKDIPENNSLKDELSEYEKLIRDTYFELASSTQAIVPTSLLKKTVYARKLNADLTNISLPQKETRILIADFFTTLIDDSRSNKRMSSEGKAIKEGTLLTYITTLKHFKKFQIKKKRKYYLDEVSQELIDAFSQYLTMDLSLSYNGIGKNMKNVRTLLNYAKQKKHISFEIMSDIKIKVAKETSTSIYLTTEEIKAMMDLSDFETDLHEVVRDLFVIGCLTGLRFSDYSTLYDARFEKSYIYKTMAKTMTNCVVPIHPMVKQILKKYPLGLPNCPTNQVFNKILKLIGQKVPELDASFQKMTTRNGKSEVKTYKKWELLQSHTARRSFCTNLYLSGVPTITIMAMSGHKSEKTFMSYIKADALQHAKVLEKYWLEKEQE